MAIRFQHGAEATLQAGKEAGARREAIRVSTQQATEAAREMDRAERFLEQARQLQTQKDIAEIRSKEAAEREKRSMEFRLAAEERGRAWEMEKMETRLQQDFQQELRDRQYGLDKFNQAKEWEIEKLGLRSRMDFEVDEKERLRDVDRAQNVINALEKEEREGRVDRAKEPTFQIRLADAYRTLDAAKAGKRPPTGLTKLPGVAEERATGRYDLAQAAAGRSEEAHTARMTGITPESIRRKRVTDVMGSAYREVPLGEAEAEMRELGLMPAPSDPSDVSVSPQELDIATAQAILQEAGGNRDRARQIAKDRGYSF